MKYTYLIWDFNGTLLDDAKACLDSVETLLKARGLPPIGSLSHYREVFCFPVIDYYRNAGFDFSKEPYEKVADEWVELYLKNSKTSTLHDGTEEVLAHFRDLGFRQIILSATESQMLRGQIRGLGIDGYFEELLGRGDVYAGSKTQLGQNWRQRHPDEKVLFIGDTEHDAETAAAMGADCVLIAAGHQSRKILEATGMPVIDNIRALPAFVGGTGD